MTIKWKIWELEKAFEVICEGVNKVDLKIEIYAQSKESEALKSYRIRVLRYDYFDVTASRFGWNESSQPPRNNEDLKAVHSMLVVDDMFDDLEIRSSSALDAFETILKKIKTQFDGSE
jgi:hypothetical protein